ncbi:DUF2267 domain-containing protein [Planosporangium mesophilum]|uniref:DUF2267 domain-containing protein n=1 Tax=Planosporangium mesophilum TaxID=689768 RepID=A0A8J3X2P6_9ACTN|nr:DUF2267 domain-containing protein [Planosporangium mesophilum]NJC86704.1 DUF2267 domain-containing protein [Planosporangium mesophilum]GII25670.1 hypothetical protein Pme01_52670 [Planosporangium mesophilum]
MNYDYFIASVAERARIPRDQAEPIACFTLNTLAQRISSGQAADLAGRLPQELRPCVAHEGPIATFHLEEFMRRIEKQMGADRPTAERVARAVLATLWTAVGPKEFADMASQLPGDFVPLLESAILEAPPRPRDEEPPFHGSLSYDDFIARVAERAGLDREGARKATEAVLEVLAMRVSAGQVEDLRPFLPYELRPALDRGLTRSRGEAMPMSLDEFVNKITQREGVSGQEAPAHARAVLSVLREAVGDKEFQDTTAQLPREYQRLLVPG